MYEYKARLKDRNGQHAVYDGDTYRMEVDVGFGVTVDIGNVRLYGVDTPEVRGDEREHGIAVRDIVRRLFTTHRRNVSEWFTVRTHKDAKGKFGRWLVDVELIDEDGQPFDLATALVVTSNARRVEY